MKYIAVLFLLLFVFCGKTFAAENSLTLSPAYVDITVKDPQEEKEVSFYITNNTKKPISLDLFSIDFQQKDEFGTIGFLGKDAKDYSYSLSSFLTFKNPNVEIAPGEKEKIDVVIVNRQDLTPGSHYAAVVARQRIEVGQKPAISPAISALVYVTKQGGERYNLSFKKFSFPQFFISFKNPSTEFLTLQNDGNTYLVPYGTVEISDMFGRKINKGIINESSSRVFPQSIRQIPVYFKHISYALPISVNTIHVNGRDLLNKTKFSYSEVYIYINPWFIAAIILIPLFILVYRKVIRKRSKKQLHD